MHSIALPEPLHMFIREHNASTQAQQHFICCLTFFKPVKFIDPLPCDFNDSDDPGIKGAWNGNGSDVGRLFIMMSEDP